MWARRPPSLSSMTIKRLQRPQHEPPANGGCGGEQGDLDALRPALAEMQPRPYPAEQDQPRRQEGLDLHSHVRVAAIVVGVGRGWGRSWLGRSWILQILSSSSRIEEARSILKFEKSRTDPVHAVDPWLARMLREDFTWGEVVAKCRVSD